MSFKTQHTLSRRQMLLGSLSLTAQAGIGCSPRRKIPGQLLGPRMDFGHASGQGVGGSIANPRHARIVIVGGGVAGLAAARALRQAGIQDFVLLELEEQVGGNARGGENALSAFPWGAHYLPIIEPNETRLRDFLLDHGVITDIDPRGLPIYDERYLCSEPMERLWLYGRWQDGLIPNSGSTTEDQKQFAHFHALMEHFKAARGDDHRYAFALPVDASSKDERFRQLDSLSMADFLRSQGYSSARLRWYVNYCCRDDYGGTLDHTSAWAGIHYFAARRGQAANAAPGTVLTWPEGNAWLIRRLAEDARAQIQTSAAVSAIRPLGDEVAIDYVDTRTSMTQQIRAKAVICALPRFVAARLIEPLRQNPPQYLDDFAYTPWMVANISLPARPNQDSVALAWDNVSYHSKSLGYIVATHQNLSVQQNSAVLTYYQPLDEFPKAVARQIAAGLSHADWVQLIIRDLSRMHPNIEQFISNIDVWLWAHGMIHPQVGMIWGENRQAALKPISSIFFAHSDMSGMSLFEEAFLRGYDAADQIVRHLKKAET